MCLEIIEFLVFLEWSRGCFCSVGCERFLGETPDEFLSEFESAIKTGRCSHCPGVVEKGPHFSGDEEHPLFEVEHYMGM